MITILVLVLLVALVRPCWWLFSGLGASTRLDATRLDASHKKSVEEHKKD